MVLFGERVGNTGAEVVLVRLGNKLVGPDVTLVLLTKEESAEVGVELELRSDVSAGCVERPVASVVEEVESESEKLTVPTVLVMVRVMITTDSLPVARGPDVLELETLEVLTAALLAVVGVGIGLADEAAVVFPALAVDVRVNATVPLLAMIVLRLADSARVVFAEFGNDDEEWEAWVLDGMGRVEFIQMGDGLGS